MTPIVTYWASIMSDIRRSYCFQKRCRLYNWGCVHMTVAVTVAFMCIRTVSVSKITMAIGSSVSVTVNGLWLQQEPPEQLLLRLRGPLGLNYEHLFKTFAQFITR